jgi:hypothetical protein
VWQRSTVSNTAEEKIAKESFLLTVFCLFLLALALIETFLFVIPTKDDADFFVALEWLQNIFPEEVKDQVFFCTKIYFAIVFPLVELPCVQISYILQHHRFQIYFLLQDLEKIDVDYEDLAEDDLTFNRNYQRSIQRKLGFCIRRHIEILNFVKRMNKQTGVFFATFTVTGCLVMVSIFEFGLLVCVF